MKSYPQNDSLFNFKLGNSLYKERNPIGNKKSILNINYKKIKKFHQKWYAANNTAIILVGNFPIKTTKSCISQHFSSVKKQLKSETKNSLYDSLNSNECRIIRGKSEKVYITIAQKNQTLSKKSNQVRKIFRKILNNRLKEKLHSQIASLWISGSFFISDTYYTTITLKNDKATKQNIKEILSEIKRLSKENISQEELDFNQKYDNEITNNNKNSSALTEMYIDAFLNRNSSSNNSFEVLPSDISKEAKNVLKKSKIRILIETMSDTLKEEPILPKTNQSKTSNFKYKYFEKKREKKEEIIKIPELNIGKAKNYLSKKYFKKLNIIELRYANGMKVYLKPLENKEKQIRIWGFAEGGTSHLPNQLYYRYESTVPYVELGGFGTLSPEQSTELLYQKGIGIIFSISEFYRDIFTSVNSKKTEDLLKILHLKMMQQHASKKEFKKVIQEEIDNIKIQKTNDLSAAEMIAMAKKEYFPQRIGAKTVQELKNLNVSEMETFYHQSFASANNWNIIIIGDFKVDTMIPLINQYLGSIPKGDPFPMNKELALKTKRKPKNQNSIKQDRTYLHQIFEKNYRPSLKNHLIIKILEKALTDNITKKLREQEGWVYSPYVNIERHTIPNSFFVLEIITDIQSNDIEKIEKETKKIILKLEKYPITDKQLNSYKKGIHIEIEDITHQKDIYQVSSFLIKTLKDKESLSNWEKSNEILKEITSSDIMKMIKNIHFITSISE